MTPDSIPATSSDVAIIAMAGRFPGAENIDEFWSLLVEGRDCARFFSDEELLSAGVDPLHLQRPGYVKANQMLRDVEMFDADLFGIKRREAEILDPQQRLMLESALVALEHAGYDPQTCEASVGVYVGAAMNTYLLHNLWRRYQEASSVEHYQLLLASDKDFLPTRISYKLNLKGPSLCINAACSTSLVAVHMACLSLLSGECDMALAGGVSIRVPQVTGYQYQEGMIFSPDGHCRAFDRDASGTLLGDGLGLVVLKRLSDALRDRDTIHAVIKGSAINNDGSTKAGYTAPSIDGQAAVVSDALAIARVEAESIGYIEAHGTATALGDPIEVAALTLAHRERTDARQYCALGSVKTNIGHLDTAAGIAGLIKTILMLEHRTLVPSLHFQEANPQIDFAGSPFHVQTCTQPWPAKDGQPLRAGVSAFGIGGTNAHMILEEAPRRAQAMATVRPELIVISANSQSQLDEATANLAQYLRRNPELCLMDVAFTQAVGRQARACRRIVIGDSVREVALALALLEQEKVFTQEVSSSEHCPAIQADPALHDMSLAAAEGGSALELYLKRLGTLWLQGCDVDWSRYFAGRTPGRIPLPTYPFRRERYWITADDGAADPKASDARSALAREIASAAPPARERILSLHLQRQVAAIIGMPGSELPDSHTSFMELALESLTLIEIVTRLGGELGIAIPASSLIEYPTIAAFSKRVIGTLAPPATPDVSKTAADGTSAEADTRRAAMLEQRRRRSDTRASRLGG